MQNLLQELRVDTISCLECVREICMLSQVFHSGTIPMQIDDSICERCMGVHENRRADVEASRLFKEMSRAVDLDDCQLQS